MRSINKAVLIPLLLSCALTTGCASTGRRVNPHTPQTELAQVDLHALPIFDGPTGLRTSWDSLVAACSRADVVLIGEIHNHPVGLAAAAALYDQTANRKPTTAALSLEFINRDKQAAVDDYLADLTDEKAFRKAAGRTNANYPAGHRAMVETARELDQPVIAANAPRQYVKLARTDGFDRLEQLTDEQRRLFVIPSDLTEGPYRDSFFEMMSGMTGHGAPPDEDAPEPTEEEKAEAEKEALEMTLGFFRAQNLWDATMAYAVANAVWDNRSPVFHVVGHFHVDNAGGLTERLHQLLPNAEIIVVTMTDETGDERTEDDANKADWIIHVGLAE